MPAHLPVIFGLGLSLGVATAIYINKDKIKEYVDQKRRELELELHSINDEIQRTFNPDTSYEMHEHELRPSTLSSSINPFSDSNRIPFTNVSASDDEEDDLYHSVPSTQLRKRSKALSIDEGVISRGYESDASSAGSEFFSYVEVKDDENEDAESLTDGLRTPTASEVGDYIQAKAFA